MRKGNSAKQRDKGYELINYQEHYMKIEEAAKAWGVTPRRVQALCAEGKIRGAMQLGREWLLPRNALKPPDGRTREGRAVVDRDMPLPRKTPFLYMSDLFREPGTADMVAHSLSYNQEARILFEAEVAYSRGDIDRVYEQASYLLRKHSGFYAVLSAGMLLAMCSIWKGDLDMWRRAKLHIAEAPSKSSHGRDTMLMAISAVDIMLYNVENFPDWFMAGCFEPLHKDAYAAATVYYAKYLYAIGYAVATNSMELEGVEGLSLMSMLPNTIEPLICWATSSGTVVAEIYLRMTCAAVYHSTGRDEQALRHIRRALDLALPDRFYGLLAEYCRVLGNLIEVCMVERDPDAWEEISALYKEYNDGWTRLSGLVRGKNLVTTLTDKQREVAKLAAFGMTNKEISATLNMSISSVKQALLSVMEKTGAERKQLAAFL